jgi:hypothetical protein
LKVKDLSPYTNDNGDCVTATIAWRPPLRRATSITAKEVPKANIQAPEKIPDPGTECLPTLADGHSLLLASAVIDRRYRKCFERFSTKCNGHPLEHILTILFFKMV